MYPRLTHQCLSQYVFAASEIISPNTCLSKVLAILCGIHTFEKDLVKLHLFRFRLFVQAYKVLLESLFLCPTAQFPFLFSGTHTFDKHDFDVFLQVIHGRAELANEKQSSKRLQVPLGSPFRLILIRQSIYFVYRCSICYKFISFYYDQVCNLSITCQKGP